MEVKVFTVTEYLYKLSRLLSGSLEFTDSMEAKTFSTAVRQ